jgi:hypothetical protein
VIRMTEKRWQAYTHVVEMLEYLQPKASTRKLRLFACACCRRVTHLLKDRRSRQALDAAEGYADGVGTPDALVPVVEAARRAEEALAARVRLKDPAEVTYSPRSARYYAARSARLCAEPEFPPEGACEVALAAREAIAHSSRANTTALSDEWRAQEQLVREVFGNPFRRVPIYPGWRWRTVLDLAESIYNERAFNRQSELADALEEVGCEDPEILFHCRDQREHVPGCWVLDLLLRNEKPDRIRSSAAEV